MAAWMTWRWRSAMSMTTRVGVFMAEADVVEAAVVAEGDASGLVDPVVADTPVGVVGAVAGAGFGTELVGGGWGDAPGQGAVRALVVVEPTNPEFVAGGPVPPIQQVALQQGEERLHVGVSPAEPTWPMEPTRP